MSVAGTLLWCSTSAASCRTLPNLRLAFLKLLRTQRRCMPARLAAEFVHTRASLITLPSQLAVKDAQARHRPCNDEAHQQCKAAVLRHQRRRRQDPNHGGPWVRLLCSCSPTTDHSEWQVVTCPVWQLVAPCIERSQRVLFCSQACLRIYILTMILELVLTIRKGKAVRKRTLPLPQELRALDRGVYGAAQQHKAR